MYTKEYTVFGITSIIIISIILLAFNSVKADSTYDKVYTELENGKPLLVVISASWCVPCQNLKQTLNSIDMKPYNINVLIVDYQSSTGRKLRSVNYVPESILFELKDGKITRKQLQLGDRSRIMALFDGYRK